MYPIVRKETLADNIILMDIKAPRVANECLPGQFIIAKTCLLYTSPSPRDSRASRMQSSA